VHKLQKNSCRTRCKFVSAASGRNDVDAHARDRGDCGFVFVFALMLAAGFFPAAGKAAGKKLEAAAKMPRRGRGARHWRRGGNQSDQPSVLARGNSREPGKLTRAFPLAVSRPARIVLRPMADFTEAG